MRHARVERLVNVVISWYLWAVGAAHSIHYTSVFRRTCFTTQFTFLEGMNRDGLGLGRGGSTGFGWAGAAGGLLEIPVGSLSSVLTFLECMSRSIDSAIRRLTEAEPLVDGDEVLNFTMAAVALAAADWAEIACGVWALGSDEVEISIALALDLLGTVLMEGGAATANERKVLTSTWQCPWSAPQGIRE